MLKEGIEEYRTRREAKQSDHEAFVGLASCLAAYYILHGLSTGDTRYFDDANKYLNDAERKDQTNQLVVLRKGMLLLAKGSYPAAEYQFNMLKQIDSQWIPGRLAMACAAFCSGKYKDALGGFQGILRSLPNGPVELRLAIGLCLARLGLADAARMAFERVTRMVPSGRAREEALIAMAVLNVNEGVRDRAAFHRGMHQLKEAYETDKNHPVPLLHLGNHFFFKQDYAKADTLLRKAISSGGSEAGFRSEALFMLGKIAHVQGKLDEAWKLYGEAVALNNNLLMAQFGLAQCLVARGDLEGAISGLERVLAKAPKCLEALRLLALLLAQTKKDPQRAEQLLRETLSRDLDSPAVNRAELWLALASILPPESALQAYREAQALIPERFKTSPQLENNLGVLSHDPSMLKSALSRCRPAGDLHDTLLYNRARLLEPTPEARSIYQELQVRRPKMVEVHLRLAALSSSPSDALEHVKEALGVSGESSAEAWAMLAATHMRQKAIVPARKAMERLLSKIDRHDLWALTALGNLHAEIASSAAPGSAREDALKRALEFYQKALSLEPRSAAAAQGVASVMASLGRWAAARDIFLQVRLAAPDNVDAATGLGHCFVELDQFGAAVSAYESVLHMAQGKQRLALVLHLARALYLQSRAERSEAAAERAVQLLRDAVKSLPKDAPLRFNLALCLQEQASVLSKAAKDEAKETEDSSNLETRLDDLLSRSHAALEEATSLLDELKGQQGVDERLLEQRRKWSDTLRTALSSRQTSASNRDQARSQHMQQLLARRAEEQQRAAEEEARKKAEWAAEQARIEAARKELAEQLRVVEQKVASAATRRAEKERDDSESDHGDEQQEDEEEIAPHTKRRNRASIVSAGRPSTLSKEFIDTDDEE